ncbi:MAG: hypothetical protein AAGI23_13215 [Bacteroidota bacterium]
MKRFYDHLLFKEYEISLEGLALYRILFAGFYLLLVGVPSFSWLSEVPDYFFYPQRFSIARPFFESIPPRLLLLLLDFGILITLICILFGYRTTLNCLLFTGLLILGYSLKFSLGKIGHAILVVILPALLAFSGWGRCLSLDQKQGDCRNKITAYSPFIVAMILGFAMFTAGWSKILNGWLAFDQFGTYNYFGLHLYILEDKGVFTSFLSSFSYPLLWKVMDYAAVLLEVLFLPVVLSRKWLRSFCLIAVVFHVSTWWILNIAYINNLLIYLLFIRWESVRTYLNNYGIIDRLHRSISWKTFIVVLSIFLVQHSYFIFVDSEFLVRDMLISPFSFFVSETIDFRQIRVIFLFLAAVFVVIADFRVHRWYRHHKTIRS